MATAVFLHGTDQAKTHSQNVLGDGLAQPL
jgi:hypothetical protein